MRNAHAVAKHNLSFKTYEVICKLDSVKNVDRGTRYNTDKSCAQLCESIARTTRSGVVDKLRDCTFCSFTCDGSTDFMGDDMENMYVRTSTKCKVEDTFMCIGVSESASSSDIYKHIKGVFKTMGVEQIMQQKLVGFCADGASNMQGCKSGLATLLKEQWPHLMTTHCLAHRLELAFKDAVKKSSPKLYEKATTLLLGLYYLFRKSPKQKKGLERAFEVLGVKQLLPTRIGGTRWLPHYMKALEVFTSVYKVIRYQLENSSHDNPKAEGLAKLMRDGHLVVYLLSLKRIISNLRKLSLYLQRGEISLADAFTRVMSTKTSLVQSISKEDSSVVNVISTEMYHGETLSFKGRKMPFDPKNMVTALVEALEKRFPQSELISATMTSSFRNWPHLQPDDIQESSYGDAAVAVLFNQFSGVMFQTGSAVAVTLDDLLDEWTTLRSLIYQKYPVELKNRSLQWENVFADLSDQELDQVFQLIELLLALPPTSVKNETAFSAMKLLKNKRRGRLGTSRLNDLMTIKLISPDIEHFDPEPAIADWMMSTPSGQKRRMKTTNRSRNLNGDVTVLNDSDHQSDVDDTNGHSDSDTIAVEQEPEPIASQSNAAAIDELMAKEVGPNGYMSDDEDEDENEMSEDTVFSLLMTFRE